MSKEMREQINKVKNWKEFLNENANSINKIVYHGTTNKSKNFIPHIINFEDEVGAHFGSTMEQAENAIIRQNELSTSDDNGRILKYQITIKNGLKVPDIGSWYPDRIFDEIIEPMNLKYPKTKHYGSGFGEVEISKRDSKDIIKIFKENGYDGLIYDNLYEGNGESYIVFNKNQIKPIN
jgi:hypothetical protein